MLRRQVGDPIERAAVGFERRRGHVVAELDLGPQPPCSRPVDRAVDDDAVQPRRERPAAVEAIEVPDGGEEGFLRDVLGGSVVAGDEARGPIGARPVLSEEPLEILDRASLGTANPGALRHTGDIRLLDLPRSRGRIGDVTRVALFLAALALVLPVSARAAACSPLNCAPSQFVLAHGTMLAVRGSVDKPVRVIDLRTGKTRWRLPPGIVTRNTLVHQDGALLTWYDAGRGTRTGDATLQQKGAFVLVGTSQDASRAVLARTQARSTTFAIVSRAAQRTIRLGGKNWQFDALNGQYLFLIQTLRFGYEVRLFDLRTNTLQRTPLKDPHESALISGVPFARASSPNGRYLFTLYVGSNGNAMIHELDTFAGAAYCIDLPGDGNFDAASTWALVPATDNGTLWAVSVGYGRVVALDVAAHELREHFSFNSVYWWSNPGTAVLAPDGEFIAVTDAQHTWLVDLAKSTVRRGPTHVATALGFSPDERTLWVVGERSRVSPLRPDLVH